MTYAASKVQGAVSRHRQPLADRHTSVTAYTVGPEERAAGVVSLSALADRGAQPRVSGAVRLDRIRARRAERGEAFDYADAPEDQADLDDIALSLNSVQLLLMAEDRDD